MISPINVKQAQTTRLEVVQTGKTRIDHVFDQAILDDTSDFDCYCDKLVTNLQLPARHGFEMFSIRRRQANGTLWDQRIITTAHFATTFTCSNIVTVAGFMRELDDFFRQFDRGLKRNGLPNYAATVNGPIQDWDLVPEFAQDQRIIQSVLNSRNLIRFHTLAHFRDNFFLEFTEKAVEIFDLPGRYLVLTADPLHRVFFDGIVAGGVFANATVFPSPDPVRVRLPGRVFSLLEEIAYLDVTVTFPVERELDVHENRERLKQYLFKIPIRRDTQGKLKVVNDKFTGVLKESMTDHTRSLLEGPIHCGRLKGGTIEDLRINLFYTTKEGKNYDIQLSRDNYVKLGFVFVKRTN